MSTVVIPAMNVGELADPAVHHRYALVVEGMSATGASWIRICHSSGMPTDDLSSLLRLAANGPYLPVDSQPSAPPAAPRIPLPRQPGPPPVEWTPPPWSSRWSATQPGRHGGDGAWYCLTRGASVLAGAGSVGETCEVEVFSDRCATADSNDSIRTSWRVVLTVGAYLASLHPDDALALARLLTEQAEMVKRGVTR
jgi:hypothetical protein